MRARPSIVAFSLLVLVAPALAGGQQSQSGQRGFRQARSLKGITGRTYRLPRSVMPSRYDVRLRIDPTANRFSGQARIAVDVGEQTSSIPLHSIGHRFQATSVRVGRRSVPVTSIERNWRSGTVTLHLAEPVPAGRAAIDLTWSGRISQGMHSLYKAEDRMHLTQFEPADLRRMVPAFDEPEFKARWAFTIDAPEHLTVLANGRLLGSESLGDGYRRNRFATTRKMSSYLVATVAAEVVPSRLTTVGKTPIRTWTLPEEAHLTGFAQMVGRQSIGRLESYFARRYPFGKMDRVAVPNFAFGAMENVGLETFRGTALLQDPRTSQLSALKRVAEVIIHEDAHQWYGNLVTMKWWNDLWLNESFATWMSFKIMDGWKPDWRIWHDFNKDRAQAFELDALESTHAIYAKVKNANDARFDVITYEKGAAVLRMLENWVGEKPFQKGIRQYIKRFAYKNAEADDLWRAVQNASSLPVERVANRWIKQEGFPLVQVTRDASGRLVLDQSRFFAEPGKSARGVWPVPMVIRYADDTGVHEERVLLDRSRKVLTLGTGKVRWIQANAGSTGFYRVAYDHELMKGLTDNISALDTAEKIGLISDTWALVQSGRAGMHTWLDLAGRLKSEKDPEVLEVLADKLLLLSDRIVSEPHRGAFEAAVVEMFGPELAKLGWEKKGSRETLRVRQRRAQLLRLIGMAGRSSEAGAEAVERVGRFLRGDTAALDPEIVPIAIRLAARSGGSAAAPLFDQYRSRYQTETDPVLRENFMIGLASFEDPALSLRAEDLLFGTEVRQQDVAAYANYLLGNRAARSSFWGRLERDWPALSDRLADAPTMLKKVVAGFDKLPGRTSYQAVKAFLARRAPSGSDEIVAQTLERMRLGVELHERTSPQVGHWLDRR